MHPPILIKKYSTVITLIFTIFTTAFLTPLDLLADKATSTKPNVVLMFIDDLGYGDIAPFGCPDIPTPNLDKLADAGVVCKSAYVTNAPCCPSRCSLLMGMYAQRFGKYGMSRGLPIPDDKPTLAKFMRDHGYVTGQIGKWDVGSIKQGPLSVGFMEVSRVPPPKKYTDEELAKLPKKTAKFIKKRKNNSKFFCVREDGSEVWLSDYDGDMMVDFIERNKEQPFFLYFSPEAVHSPSYEVPERLMSRTQAKGTRRMLAGAIVSIDDQVGKLFEVLNKHKLTNKTMIIFSSDNGPNLKEEGTATPYSGGKGKGTQREGWVRVPAILSYPNHIPQGKIYEGMMCTLDFYSTIAAVMGQPAPSHCDGVNLIPYLNHEEQKDAHEYLYWLNNDPHDSKHRHVTAARWKNYRLYKHDKHGWQLFDLKSDPIEKKDLAKDKPEVVKNMEEKFEAWKKTLAPLKKNPGLQQHLAPGRIPQGHGWALAEKES